MSFFAHFCSRFGTVDDLNGVLDVPLLDENSEEKLLRAILTAMLSDGSIANHAASAAAYSSVSGVQGVLDATKRKEMVEKINETVDIPLLSEEQEAVIIDKCLTTVADVSIYIVVACDFIQAPDF